MEEINDSIYHLHPYIIDKSLIFKVKNETATLKPISISSAPEENRKCFD